MKLYNSCSKSVQTGFSLIEIMIGLVIGLIATLVITQVMSVFEGQKRSTTGSADAQTNGQIALYNISREMQIAGYPLMPTGKANLADSPLECTSLTVDHTASPDPLAGVGGVDPITITNGVGVAGTSSASDTITIRYGSSVMGGVPTQIGSVSGSVLALGSNFGCAVGDITFITNGSSCAMSTVTAKTAAGVTPQTVTLRSAAGAAVNANIACLGGWNQLTYAVNNASLQRNGVDNVAGVVNIQAQYGVSTSANSNVITQWVDATGAFAPASLGLAPATRNRIKAVRVAIIARNSKIEQSAVTALCSSRTAAAPTGLCAWPAAQVGGAVTAVQTAPEVKLSDGDANWANYRYRVYETIIPLRNIIWSKGTL